MIRRSDTISSGDGRQVTMPNVPSYSRLMMLLSLGMSLSTGSVIDRECPRSMIDPPVRRRGMECRDSGLSPPGT